MLFRWVCGPRSTNASIRVLNIKKQSDIGYSFSEKNEDAKLSSSV